MIPKNTPRSEQGQVSPEFIMLALIAVVFIGGVMFFAAPVLRAAGL